MDSLSGLSDILGVTGVVTTGMALVMKWFLGKIDGKIDRLATGQEKAIQVAVNGIKALSDQIEDARKRGSLERDQKFGLETVAIRDLVKEISEDRRQNSTERMAIATALAGIEGRIGAVK